MTDSTFSLHQKRALITGASSGLGPYIARRLDAAGASIGIHYHQNAEGASSLASELTQSNVSVKANLGDTAEVEALFQQVLDGLGGIDILVNCAAVESQDVGDLASMSAERWAATQKTNVEAPLLLSQMFAAQNQPGVIINVSSIEASRPAPGHGH